MYFGPNWPPSKIRDQDQNHMLKPCLKRHIFVYVNVCVRRFRKHWDGTLTETLQVALLIKEGSIFGSSATCLSAVYSYLSIHSKFLCEGKIEDWGGKDHLSTTNKSTIPISHNAFKHSNDEPAALNYVTY